MPGSGPSYFSVTRKCWIDVVQRGPLGALIDLSRSSHLAVDASSQLAIAGRLER